MGTTIEDTRDYLERTRRYLQDKTDEAARIMERFAAQGDWQRARDWEIRKNVWVQNLNAFESRANQFRDRVLTEHRDHTSTRTTHAVTAIVKRILDESLVVQLDDGTAVNRIASQVAREVADLRTEPARDHDPLCSGPQHHPGLCLPLGHWEASELVGGHLVIREVDTGRLLSYDGLRWSEVTEPCVCDPLSWDPRCTVHPEPKIPPFPPFEKSRIDSAGQLNCSVTGALGSCMLPQGHSGAHRWVRITNTEVDRSNAEDVVKRFIEAGNVIEGMGDLVEGAETYDPDGTIQDGAPRCEARSTLLDQQCTQRAGHQPAWHTFTSEDPGEVREPERCYHHVLGEPGCICVDPGCHIPHPHSGQCCTNDEPCMLTHDYGSINPVLREIRARGLCENPMGCTLPAGHEGQHSCTLHPECWLPYGHTGLCQDIARRYLGSAVYGGTRRRCTNLHERLQWRCVLPEGHEGRHLPYEEDGSPDEDVVDSQARPTDDPTDLPFISGVVLAPDPGDLAAYMAEQGLRAGDVLTDEQARVVRELGGHVVGPLGDPEVTDEIREAAERAAQAGYARTPTPIETIREREQRYLANRRLPDWGAFPIETDPSVPPGEIRVREHVVLCSALFGCVNEDGHDGPHLVHMNGNDQPPVQVSTGMPLPNERIGQPECVIGACEKPANHTGPHTFTVTSADGTSGDLPFEVDPEDESLVVPLVIPLGDPDPLANHENDRFLPLLADPKDPVEEVLDDALDVPERPNGEDADPVVCNDCGWTRGHQSGCRALQYVAHVPDEEPKHIDSCVTVCPSCGSTADHEVGCPVDVP